MDYFTAKQILYWFDNCPLADLVWDLARDVRWNAYLEILRERAERLNVDD